MPVQPVGLCVLEWASRLFAWEASDHIVIHIFHPPSLQALPYRKGFLCAFEFDCKPSVNPVLSCLSYQIILNTVQRYRNNFMRTIRNYWWLTFQHLGPSSQHLMVLPLVRLYHLLGECISCPCHILLQLKDLFVSLVQHIGYFWFMKIQGISETGACHITFITGKSQCSENIVVKTICYNTKLFC